jgi:hypothetical protein
VRGYDKHVPAVELNEHGVGGSGPEWSWPAPGPRTDFIAKTGEALISLLSLAALDPSCPPGFVAVVLDSRDRRTAKSGIWLQVRSGQITAGPGKYMFSSGQAAAVQIDSVWLYDGSMPYLISPDDADKVVVWITGVAGDVALPGSLLVREGELA